MNPQEEKVNQQEENELCNQEYHIFKNSKNLDKLAPKIRPAIISGSLFWLFAVPMSTLKKGFFVKLRPGESKLMKLRKKLEIYKILAGRGNIRGPIFPI